MPNIQHPSFYLQPEWVTILRNSSFEAERAGKLQPEQLKLIIDQQWFNLLAPAKYGGLEKTLPEVVRIEESLSWADGSAGWVITLCAGAGWFGGFLNAQLAEAIFKVPGVCFAGSGAATGTAELTRKGYIISGNWKYASGVHHATHITANCVVVKDGEALLNADGTQMIIPFVFDRKDVQLLPGWKYTGMMGTGSDAYEVKDVFVDFNRSFKIDPAAVVVDKPLYRYPFYQLAEATLAANISGIAYHFIDLAEGIFTERIGHDKRLNDKQRAVLKDMLTHVVQQLEKARSNFYAAVDFSWKQLTTEKEIGKESLEEVSSTSRTLARIARESTDQLYPYCGLIAAAPDSPINQVWRDLHTASQHALLTFPE
jgi:alkylation response protein AidB-like acyl-CoA dehydrogenase